MAQRGRDIPEGLLELYGVDPTGGKTWRDKLDDWSDGPTPEYGTPEYASGKVDVSPIDPSDLVSGGAMAVGGLLSLAKALGRKAVSKAASVAVPAFVKTAAKPAIENAAKHEVLGAGIDASKMNLDEFARYIRTLGTYPRFKISEFNGAQAIDEFGTSELQPLLNRMHKASGFPEARRPSLSVRNKGDEETFLGKYSPLDNRIVVNKAESWHSPDPRQALHDYRHKEAGTLAHEYYGHAKPWLDGPNERWRLYNRRLGGQREATELYDPSFRLTNDNLGRLMTNSRENVFLIYAREYPERMRPFWRDFAKIGNNVNHPDFKRLMKENIRYAVGTKRNWDANGFSGTSPLLHDYLVGAGHYGLPYRSEIEIGYERLARQVAEQGGELPSKTLDRFQFLRDLQEAAATKANAVTPSVAVGDVPASPWSRIDPVGVGLMGAGATGLMMNKRKKGEEENSSSGPSELPAGMYRELIRSLGR
jgi:hypothetical protein